MAFRILSADFIQSAAEPKQFISTEVAEVAFAGGLGMGKGCQRS